jgi:hypothetical protein
MYTVIHRATSKKNKAIYLKMPQIKQGGILKNIQTMYRKVKNKRETEQKSKETN